MKIITGKKFISEEFINTELYDKRLNKRLEKVVENINSNPSASIPHMHNGSKAEIKGMYRFFQNEKVNDQALLQTHYLNTSHRCMNYPGKILLLSDSTFVATAKKMEGLKKKGKGEEKFLRIHYVLAVAAEGGDVLGMLDFRTMSSNLKKTSITLKDESDIWTLTAKSSVNRILALGQGDELLQRCLYVADREADDYEILSTLKSLKLGFIIRSQYNREIFVNDQEGKIDDFKNQEFLHGKPYEIETQKSSGGKRKARVRRSVLSDVSINAPKKTNGGVLHDLNLVMVKEVDSDLEEKDQVSWRLITTESVEKLSDSENIVNFYAKRWSIEEMNKCAKTGVKVEQRQFQELEYIKPFLAIAYVVAWRILAIRTISKEDEKRPIEEVFSKDECDYFETVSENYVEEEKIKTVKNAMEYIAKLGGFLGTYKNPGWIVLWQGWLTLSYQVTGHAMAMNRKSKE